MEHDTRANLPVAATTRREWTILLLVMMLVAVGHFNRTSISVAGNGAIIASDPTASSSADSEHSGSGPVQLSSKDMGQIYTAFLVLYTAFMIPGGWLIDRLGPKRTLAVTIFGSAVFTICTGLIGLICQTPMSLWLGLMGTRSLMGITNSPLHPGSARTVGNWFPVHARNWANGMVTFAACAGMSIVYVVFGTMVDYVGWQGAFLLSGAASCVLGTVWILYASDRSDHQPSEVVVHDLNQIHPDVESDLPTSATPSADQGALAGGKQLSQDKEDATVLSILLNRSLIFLAASYVMVGYFQYLFFYWMEYYFDKILGYDATASRYLSSAMTMSMGIGMVVGGRLGDWCSSLPIRNSHRLVPIVGFLASAVLVISANYCESTNLKIGFYILSMFGVGATEGPFWTLAVRLGRQRGGTAGAFMNTLGNIGGLIAPVAMPYIADKFGWESGMYIAGFVCAAGGLLWLGVSSDKDAVGDRS